MDLSTLPTTTSLDGVELLRVAALAHKLKKVQAPYHRPITGHPTDSSGSTTSIPACVWSRLPMYSKHALHMKQVLTAVSPSARIALTPISAHTAGAAAQGGYRSSSVATVDSHDDVGYHRHTRPYTPSIPTPLSSAPPSPSFSPASAPMVVGLSCEALRVHRWWLWGLQSFPLNLDIHLGTITSTAEGAASTAHGADMQNTEAVAPTACGFGPWGTGTTPGSLRNTPLLGFATPSPMMLLGSSRSSGQQVQRTASNTAATIVESVWRNPGAATTPTTSANGASAGTPTQSASLKLPPATSSQEETLKSTAPPSHVGGGGCSFDFFPSEPVDPVSLAFPFFE